MKGNALAIALTLLVAALLGGLLWWDYQRPSLLTATSERPTVPESAEHAPATRPSFNARAVPKPHPLEGGLYRCEGLGGTQYQSEPCQAGTKQAEVTGGTLSVVSPPPSQRIAAPTSTRREGGWVGLIARTPLQEADNKRECEAHEAAIKKIDAAGRAGWRDVLENGAATRTAPSPQRSAVGVEVRFLGHFTARISFSTVCPRGNGPYHLA